MKYRGNYLGVSVLIIILAFVLVSCARKHEPVKVLPSTNKTEVQREREKKGEYNATEQKRRLKKEKEAVEEYQLEQEERERQELKEKKEKERKQARKKAIENIKRMIHFAFDSSQLSSQARKILKKKAALLKKYSEINLIIEGHCDERGTEEYNLALGERRSKAASEFLVLLGVDPSRMNCISYGEEDPLVKGHNEEAWAKNRRNEFVIEK